MDVWHLGMGQNPVALVNTKNYGIIIYKEVSMLYISTSLNQPMIHGVGWWFMGNPGKSNHQPLGVIKAIVPK